MNILRAILLILEVLSSFLLIGVILIQKSKGGGLSGAAFGGGGGESIFGARAGNVLTRITIGLSIFFLGNTLILAFIYAETSDSSLMSDVDASNTEILPVESVVPTPESDDQSGLVLTPEAVDAFPPSDPVQETLPASDPVFTPDAVNDGGDLPPEAGVSKPQPDS